MKTEDSQQKMQFPLNGKKPEDISRLLDQAGEDDANWRSGKTFSLVFYGGDELSKVSQNAYMKYYYENGLNPTVFPSLRKFETEVVSMSADLMHGDSEVVGNMTSGGTESILCAVKTAKHYALSKNPNIKPEMVVAQSIHPAFDKAANYFGIKIKHFPVRKDKRADVKAMEAAINENTILIVGSAPSYPHGVVDPIEELAEVAKKHNILMHVDACVGGYMLPWVERLGYPIPKFDFRVDGVTSMSMDLHKYGYAAKGASCVLYRNSELRKHQYFVYSGWSGGIYASPSIAGTRPGGSIAAAWAVLNYLGEEGYMRIAKGVMQATEKIKKAVDKMDGIYIVSNPDMSLLAIGSDDIDVMELGDELQLKGWSIDRQQNPSTLHLTLSQGNMHIADEFIKDTKQALFKVKKFSLNKIATKATTSFIKGASKVLSEDNMSKLTAFLSKMGGAGLPKRTAPMYGMMGALPNKGDLDEMILNMMDGLNKMD